ncbi:putative B3 domain-containing protein Os03g0621600 [Macadamia integrifolia]|uniref:putative B3 domain-containing protein Os03g0621600 n=1 Tax=Macadamia integrifolia TaxID=60698 RepID=UPI001C4EBE16|nr:putative B3 domain-containing protein Os03g0621600 [Macadamia integrifolia]
MGHCEIVEGSALADPPLPGQVAHQAWFAGVLMEGSLLGHSPALPLVVKGDVQMKIPRDFIEHVNGKLPGNFNLRSGNGTYWCVKVKKIKDGWFFLKGWNRFVKFHFLKVGEFLIFTYRGDSKFSVTIFDRSACEKELPLTKWRRRNDHEGEERKTQFTKEVVEPREELVEKKKIGVHKIRINGRLESVHLLETERPHLTQILKPNLRNQITFPKALLAETGLVGKERILLWNPQGRSWPMRLHLKKDGRGQITTGWNDFCKENNLVNGDAIVF